MNFGNRLAYRIRRIVKCIAGPGIARAERIPAGCDVEKTSHTTRLTYYKW